MQRSFLACLALLFCVFAAGTAGAQTPDAAAVAAQLKQGGYVIVFRHGATHRDQADTDPLNPANVASQRVLSEAGREQARQIGAVFRKLGIPIGTVLTSRFNRAYETGKAIGGAEPVATDDLTEGGLVVSPIENDRRAEALRKLAATPPAAGTNTLLVTHKPNIIDAFGKDWFEVKEGEATVFKPDGQGKAQAVARVPAAAWGAVAR